MPTAKLAASAALLGGLLWVAHAVLGGGSDPLPGALHVLGLASVLLASAVFGTSLVKSDATAMRVTVGIASALLTLSVVEAFRPADTPWYDGAWGVLFVLLGGVALLRGRGRDKPPRRTGAHAR